MRRISAHCTRKTADTKDYEDEKDWDRLAKKLLV